MRLMGADDAADEVIDEEAVIKDAAGKVDTFTTHYTHHSSKTSSKKLEILAQS